MGEVIRFVSKSDRERLLLIQEARAQYESVFPSTNSANEQRHGASIARAVGDTDIRKGADVQS